MNQVFVKKVIITVKREGVERKGGGGEEEKKKKKEYK